MKEFKVEHNIDGMHNALERWNPSVPYEVKAAVIDALYRDMMDLHEDTESYFVKSFYFFLRGMDPISTGFVMEDEDKAYLAKIIKEDIDIEIPTDDMNSIGTVSELLTITDECYKNGNGKKKVQP